ncbi:MAG: hypothetical protein ABSE62_08915 [Chthoniobacteraceae bacterium]|jgi:hypothetical protein
MPLDESSEAEGQAGRRFCLIEYDLTLNRLIPRLLLKIETSDRPDVAALDAILRLFCPQDSAQPSQSCSVTVFNMDICGYPYQRMVVTSEVE